jgi:hypothetical protein
VAVRSVGLDDVAAVLPCGPQVAHILQRSFL